ncbi:prolipoprotein diacylglyceryl transferase [Candidatus Contubernalis alkaliaceticus]|uniref:prolipoprotein diacylglyceryl transferase n=1 Tax=Candidatus Contubernalis alkaliaceticus TaxID=338645 RepID=UPI001F4BF6B4|nr:prolipoprotein diacylglyceryl transferase [Candidatus Contubernalis alkalaceticus]UNC93103.1 prolipoprotein diacylglyceryl transferase [Candidatus Contubernalis alkalaceticus]
MFIEGINPVIFTIGPLTVHWYGLMMSIAAVIGSHLFLSNGKKMGMDEDNLLNITILTILGALVGARALFVLTNWGFYSANPQEIIRVDHGGLAFHGAILGGILSAWVMSKRYSFDFGNILDLTVPGISITYMLIRIANIFNQELLGRTAELLPFERHPAQIYGFFIGLSMLLLHNYLVRNRSYKPGGFFWAFFLVYSFFRGFIEETFRVMPLPFWGYVNEAWGAGFISLTQLMTPALMLLGWWMFKRSQHV